MATLLQPEYPWTLFVLIALIGTVWLLKRNICRLLFVQTQAKTYARMVLARNKVRRGITFTVLLVSCLWIGARAVFNIPPGEEVLIVLVMIPVLVGFEAWMDLLDEHLLDRDDSRRDRRSGDRRG
jgi:hypothetical protein